MQCMRDGRMDVAQVHAEVVLRQRLELVRTHRVLANVERLCDDLQRVLRAMPADPKAVAASSLVEQLAAVQADVRQLETAGTPAAVLESEANQQIDQLLAEIRQQMSPERRPRGGVPTDETTPTRQQDELIRRLNELRRP